MNAEGGSRTKVSDYSVRRLSVYHRILDELKASGTAVVSSARLASLAGTNSAQIRKDLSYFGTFGKRGSGYPVVELRRRILEILGLTRTWKVALVGAGNLGHALFSYREFGRYGFDFVAVFDNDPSKIGTVWEDIVIAPFHQCEEVLLASGAELALITTPAAVAPEVAERLSRGGVRGILNFAPVRIESPPGVWVRSFNITVELESLSYALRNSVA